MNHKNTTTSKYRYLLDTHLLPDLGGKEISSLDEDYLSNYIEQKMKNGRKKGGGGLAPSTIRTLVFIIASGLQYASENGFCGPISLRINKPPLPKRELTILTTKEEKRLNDFLLKSEHDPTKLGILLALHMGLRVGEVCALRWNDIDLKNKVVFIRQSVIRINGQDGRRSRTMLGPPKTKTSERIIPISSFLLPVLSEYSELTQSPFAVSDNDDFVKPRTFEYRYRRMIRQVNIPQINFHALRHTFATRCVEAGVDVKTLSELLGHSNVTMTLNTYVHSSLELKRAQLEKLENYYAGLN